MFIALISNIYFFLDLHASALRKLNRNLAKIMNKFNRYCMSILLIDFFLGDEEQTEAFYPKWRQYVDNAF